MLGLWSVTQGGPYTPIPAVLLFTGRDSGPLMSTRPVYSPQRREVRPRRPPSRSPVPRTPGTADGSRARIVVATNVRRIVGEADVAPEIAPFIAAFITGVATIDAAL